MYKDSSKYDIKEKSFNEIEKINVANSFKSDVWVLHNWPKIKYYFLQIPMFGMKWQKVIKK